jgi:hypothetical protein
VPFGARTFVLTPRTRKRFACVCLKDFGELKMLRHSFRFNFRFALFLLSIFSFVPAFAFAQEHQHQTHEMPDMNQTPSRTSTPTPSPTPVSAPTPADHNSHAAHPPHDMNEVSEHNRAKTASDAEAHSMREGMNANSLMTMDENEMKIRLGDSQTNFMSIGQMGSGTSWQPASSPLWMTHRSFGEWLVMFHGEARLGLNAQGGARGATKFESTNWLMPMAFHRLGSGTLELRGMFSLEPLTFARGGTPELFQTGETYKGAPLIDRQHPHDLFMELSAEYTLPVGERASFFAYFGFPGEPALGPVAYMHRASASENPSAPLSHHLQDSTHISFGVLTSGFAFSKFKLEGSIFNGREPDENRYNFEFHPLDSYSARLSFAPTRNWTMQVSQGFLKNPEALEPGTTRRATASIQYNRPFARGNWASAVIWGRNDVHARTGERFHLNGYTAESTLNFLDKNYAYTRLELVDKNELLRAVDQLRLGIRDEHASFRIGAYTFGYARDVAVIKSLLVGVGSDVTFYSKPSALDALYGKNPVSYKIFVRLRPRRMEMNSGRMNHQMHEMEMHEDAMP